MVNTKQGITVTKVIPTESGCAQLIGALKGKIRIHGDVFSTGLEWDADMHIPRPIVGGRSARSPGVRLCQALNGRKCTTAGATVTGIRGRATRLSASKRLSLLVHMQGRMSFGK